jgi:hypothetical protein
MLSRGWGGSGSFQPEAVIIRVKIDDFKVSRGFLL